MSARKSTKERLDEKYVIDDEPGCWIWTAGKNKQGYGRISVCNKARLAHRVSYELHVGDIPDGLDLLHKCDNPACINPACLFPGTHQDNMEDMVKKGRSGRRPSIDRFHESYEVNQETGCWEWQKSLHCKTGKPQFWGDEGITPAARWIYIHTNGPLKRNVTVQRKCSCSICVNPRCHYTDTLSEKALREIKAGTSNIGGRTGSLNGLAKLTEQDVILVKQFLLRHPASRPGGQCSFLARWFGVSKTVMSNINTGKVWNHVKV